MTRFTLVRRVALLAVAPLFVCLAAPALACDFPHQGDSRTDEIVANIREQFSCAVPWRALRRAAARPADLRRLRAAYAAARTANPRETRYVDEMANMLEAAAGRPEAMLAFYDENATRHPEDRSLLTTPCWARGAHNLDLAHAMKWCDAAMAGPHQANAPANRAQVLLLLHDWAGARRDYDLALADPIYRSGGIGATALYGRGIARLRLGDEQGRDDMAKAAIRLPGVAADFAELGVTP